MALVGKLVLAVTFLPIPILIVILSNINYYYHYATHEEVPPGQVFDYIVVGSGSAGAPIANRLSKNSKVLLLEAGGDPLPMNFVPAFVPVMVNYPQTDWMHETVPQKNALLLTKNQICKWSRGKSLGGTSNVNALLYVRGNPLDYENWTNLTGDPTWKYENVLPSFKRSLDYHGDHAANEAHYGQTPYGHLSIEALPKGPLNKAWTDAGKELGYEERDLNGPQAPGFGGLEITRRNGKRCSTYSAFLEGILDRKNLVISKYSQVVKIQLDKHNRAVGVWFIQHGVKKYARASREIIVSAGAIDSPKLLMLSGIGPKKHLKSVGIKPRVDLPVGKNLQDHLQVTLFNVLIDKPLTFVPTDAYGFSSWAEYLFKGSGPLALPWPANGQAFVSTSNVLKSGGSGMDWPDIQIVVMGSVITETTHLELAQMMNLDADVLKEYFHQSIGRHALSFMPVLMRPKSVGEILLRDKNPLSPLLIDPHYLEKPQDVRALVEGLQLSVRLVETTRSYKELGAKVAPVPLLPCNQHKFKSDAYFECYVRHMATTIWHMAGTCRMGRASDPSTVVDSKLRVKGVHGLRVADTSIMPAVVNANTNAAAIMIGEKAAELIRDFWAQQFLVCDKLEPVLAFSKKFRLGHNHQRVCHYSKLV